ncbi:MAG TPA: hypothetical protein PLK00_11940, partial [Candidatus Hydrogenedentes bacterium]|nr:hypothetical protein [Candidatus Hydrogenedentota bacterium]
MTLEERVAALEAQLASPAPREIVASRLILTDENGKARAHMYVSKSKEGPALCLIDENSKTRCQLFVSRSGPSLCLGDENS